jgi:hypothetical protein
MFVKHHQGHGALTRVFTDSDMTLQRERHHWNNDGKDELVLSFVNVMLPSLRRCVPRTPHRKQRRLRMLLMTVVPEATTVLHEWHLVGDSRIDPRTQQMPLWSRPMFCPISNLQTIPWRLLLRVLYSAVDVDSRGGFHVLDTK